MNSNQLPENDLVVKAWLASRTRRSFLTGGAAALVALGGWGWLRSRRLDEGLPWPFRRALELNGDLWREYFDPRRLSPSAPPPPAGKKPRVNGRIGLPAGINPTNWELSVSTPPPESETVHLKLTDLKWLPKVETTTEFHCIEGWSEVISYAGVRFSDFMKHYKLGIRPEDAQPYAYVGLRTPDDKYYVSIDMDSMLHPQTVLAYEMNGKPLAPENGAPLRLIIPIKYGIKSLKCIGSIQFADTRPPDYWAERGYDWYAGL